MLPANSSHSGWMRVTLPRMATAAVMAPSSQLCTEDSVISEALAATSPTVMGKMPACTMPRQGRS